MKHPPDARYVADQCFEARFAGGYQAGEFRLCIRRDRQTLSRVVRRLFRLQDRPGSRPGAGRFRSEPQAFKPAIFSDLRFEKCIEKSVHRFCWCCSAAGRSNTHSPDWMTWKGLGRGPGRTSPAVSAGQVRDFHRLSGCIVPSPARVRNGFPLAGRSVPDYRHSWRSGRRFVRVLER